MWRLAVHLRRLGRDVPRAVGRAAGAKFDDRVADDDRRGVVRAEGVLDVVGLEAHVVNDVGGLRRVVVVDLQDDVGDRAGSHTEARGIGRMKSPMPTPMSR